MVWDLDLLDPVAETHPMTNTRPNLITRCLAQFDYSVFQSNDSMAHYCRYHRALQHFAFPVRLLPHLSLKDRDFCYDSLYITIGN